MVRLYAMAAAAAFLAGGVAGFSKLWGFDPVTGFYHAGVGLLFAYVGFLQRDEPTVRRMVGGLGVLLVVTKSASVLVGLVWFGLFERGPVEVACLVLGVGSILAARYLPDGTPRSGRGRRRRP